MNEKQLQALREWLEDQSDYAAKQMHLPDVQDDPEMYGYWSGQNYSFELMLDKLNTL
jgi:hypothetical protein